MSIIKRWMRRTANRARAWWHRHKRKVAVAAGTVALVGVALVQLSTAWVYLLHGNTLLYVGITNNVARRVAEHAVCKAWWPQVTRVWSLPAVNREVALWVERFLIRNLRPAYNIVHAVVR